VSVTEIPPVTEKEFQSQVEQFARLCGWTLYHTFRSEHSAQGFPDLVAIRPPRVVFAELKSDAGRLTGHQRQWLDLLRQCAAVESYCWRPCHWALIQAALR
jgi:VRR-NUC domain